MSCFMVMYARELGRIPKEPSSPGAGGRQRANTPSIFPFYYVISGMYRQTRGREDAQSYGVSVVLGRVSGTGEDSQRKPRE